MRDGASAEALRLVGAAIEEWPAEAGLYLRASALTLMEGGSYDESLELATRAAELSHGDPETRFRCAQWLFELGRVDAADEIVSEMRDMVDDEAPSFAAELMLLFGLILEHRGQLVLAERALSEVLDELPRDAGEALVRLYLSSGRSVEARGVVERALAHAPDDPWLLGMQKELSAVTFSPSSSHQSSSTNASARGVQRISWRLRR